MNKEFMVLSDDSFVVMDEFGHIEKRIYCNNDIESILLSENKIEMLTNKINSLNKKYSEYNMGVSLSTKMIKATPFIILLTTLMGFVLGYFCSVGNFFYGMYSGLLNLIISSFAGGIEVVYFSVVKNAIKKKIKKLDLEINSAVV